MSRRTRPWPAGLPCWTDLASPDPAAARDFCAAVLGWEFRLRGDAPDSYAHVLVDGQVAAGVGPVSDAQPGGWSVYLATADADATARAALAAGGRVVAGPEAIGPQGRVLFVADPSGAVTGAWEAGALIGAGVVNEPGALVWEDLRSADPDASRAFLREVFGLEADSFDGAPGGYTTLRLADEQVPCGGVGPLFGAPEPGWLVYFLVPDTDAAVAAASAHGGAVPGPPDDTPFGRMAVVADPHGARFAVMSAPDGAPQPDRS
ncbi:VOC family protein [Quadrisphaera sp. KR29]|uniref:VOC family protein n=1 Tax=Quadrisphaera sp. KR29 TaxID=3461391 RepID=UPI0040449CE1